MSFPPHRGAMPSKLITHFEKDRVLLGERAERFELIALVVNRADQAEADFFVPGRRVADGWIGHVVSFRIVADENIWENRVAEISRARSERQRR